MNLVRTRAEIRALARGARGPGHSIGLVPTMGALHQGHLSLVRAARASTDVTVVSIFVNPLQFGPTEDLHAYPRDEPGDLRRAESEGVDIVFAPSVDEMYRREPSTTIDVGELGEIFEGEARPGHFRGVCTVVAKLFNLVEPDRAFFGQKDAQQVAVVRRMAADLFYELEVVVCPTVREPDGLALSSRNAYLSGDERTRATALFRALLAGREALENTGSFERAERTMHAVLASERGVEADYARAVEPATFRPAGAGGATLLVVAARVGATRLIDNLLVEPRR